MFTPPSTKVTTGTKASGIACSSLTSGSACSSLGIVAKKSARETCAGARQSASMSLAGPCTPRRYEPYGTSTPPAASASASSMPFDTPTDLQKLATSVCSRRTQSARLRTTRGDSTGYRCGSACSASSSAAVRSSSSGVGCAIDTGSVMPCVSGRPPALAPAIATDARGGTTGATRALLAASTTARRPPLALRTLIHAHGHARRRRPTHTHTTPASGRAPRRSDPAGACAGRAGGRLSDSSETCDEAGVVAHQESAPHHQRPARDGPHSRDR
mmetsp:Transcript_25418/g.88700  ORF Transcript_25418/g.88700 Transcript_25418/m.88700 type:complete len:272 (+) Transcript_25418:488-1303(+)